MCGSSPASARSRPAGSARGMSSRSGPGPTSSASRRRAASVPDSSRPPAGGPGPAPPGDLRPTDVRRSPGLDPDRGGRGGGFRRLGRRRGLGRVPLAWRSRQRPTATADRAARVSSRSGISATRRPGRARTRTGTGPSTTGTRSTARCTTRGLTNCWDITRRSRTRRGTGRTAPMSWTSRPETARRAARPVSRPTRT